MSVKSKLLATLKSWAERRDGKPQQPPVPGRPGSTGSNPDTTTLSKVHPNEGFFKG